MTDGVLHPPEAQLPGEAHRVQMQLDLELEVDEEVSKEELASLIMDAIDDNDGVSIDFACTTISDD